MSTEVRPMTDFTNLDDYIANKILSQSIELAKLRKTKQLKQTELAALMGVSQASISKVESGKDIQLSTLQNYVRALGGEVNIIAKMPNSDVILI